MQKLTIKEYIESTSRAKSGIFNELKSKILSVLESQEFNNEVIEDNAIVQFNLLQDFEIEKVHYQSGFLKLKRDVDIQKYRVEISTLKRTESQDSHYVYDLIVKFN